MELSRCVAVSELSVSSTTTADSSPRMIEWQRIGSPRKNHFIPKEYRQSPTRIVNYAG